MLRKYDDEYNKEKIYITHFGFIKSRTISKWKMDIVFYFNDTSTNELLIWKIIIIIIINAVDELIQFHTINTNPTLLSVKNKHCLL